MKATNHPDPYDLPRTEVARCGRRAVQAVLPVALAATLACAMTDDARENPPDGQSDPETGDAGRDGTGCPAAMACGGRVCGLDPVCGLSCGRCDAGGSCSAEGTCTPADRCGDGVRSPVEECEGDDLGGASCESLGYPDGRLACTPGCLLDARGCAASDELLVGNGQHAGIAVAADRSVHVVYVDGGVRYRRFAAGTFGPEELVRTGSAHWPQVAVSADGDVHVVWEEGTFGTRIWYARRTGGTWLMFTIHEGSRAMLPRVAVDSRGRAHIVYWEVLKPDAPNVGWYKRVALDGTGAGVDLERLIDGWNVARNGDVTVGADDVVHVFAGSLAGVSHWTVSESGEFTPAAGLTKPAGTARTGELFDVTDGPRGAFYAATTGNAEGTAPVYHLRSDGASQVVWPDIGDPHESVTTAADLVAAGRVFVIFADNERRGQVVSVEADGRILGPVPFAEAGEQHTDEHLDRFTNVGAGIPGEEGLWIAYQDNRSGHWQILLRRLTAEFIEIHP